MKPLELHFMPEQTAHFVSNRFDDDFAREIQTAHFPRDRYDDRRYNFNPEESFASLSKDAIPCDPIVEKEG